MTESIAIFKKFNSMLKVYGFLVSLSLIVLIFIQIPQESRGLQNFSRKTKALGSSKRIVRFLNLLIGILILLYFGIAIRLNLLDR